MRAVTSFLRPWRILPPALESTMSLLLRPCPACAEMVYTNTCVCPHCGEAKVCRSRAVPQSAALLGIALAGSGCFATGSSDYTAAPDSGWYDDDDDTSSEGAPEHRDQDGDGLTPAQGDCDDTLSTVNPFATDQAFDDVDSDCDGFLDG